MHLILIAIPVARVPNILHRPLSSARHIAAATLIILAATVNAVAAIPGIPGTAAAPKTAAAKPAAPDQRTQTQEQLAEARRQLEASGAPVEGDSLTTERQRVLERMVVAYGERLKLLDDLDTLRKTHPYTLNQQRFTAEFAGPPPYSAIRVDELRQEFNAGRERLQSQASTARALDSQKRAQIEAQRRAAEALRLAEDRLARARSDEEIERERHNRDLAALRLKLNDAELANIALGEELVQAEIAGLQTTSADLQALIERVLPGQRLSEEEAEQQQARLRDMTAKLAGELDRRIAENTRRAAEREQLAKSLAGAEPAIDDARRLKLLDEALETDRVVLMTLNWLQTLTQIVSDAWVQRYRGLSTDDAQTRLAVTTVLSRIREELRTRKPLFDDLQAAAQVAVREQELRIDGTTLDAAAATYESAILGSLKQRLQAYQRINQAAERFDRQLERWLTGDFGYAGEGTSSYWTVTALQIAEKLKQVWNFEMFAVEDSTLVDGKTVTVTYGVTIGKSFGALLLFVFGYWLFSRLARRLQRIMVERFGVNQQVASVIRRWAMISLAVVLIVFILNLARIPLTVFAFMGGALAIGIGFGTQTIIKNVISGIIILFERKIRVGDIIALGGMTGHVTAVDLRASTVRGFDGVEALVPNSSFLENQVVNWTYSNAEIRREIRIGIAYGSPVHEAADIIASCAEDHGQVLKDPPPAVFFEDFGDNALIMALVFWVELGPNTVSRRIDSDLRYAMEKRLAAAGIAIPFPQRDVRLSLGEALPVKIVPPTDNVTAPGNSTLPG